MRQTEKHDTDIAYETGHKHRAIRKPTNITGPAKSSFKANSHILCRAPAVPCRANSRMPSSQQCCVLRESPRVSGKIRTANREIPRGIRKKPTLGRLSIARRETTDVNLHAPCRAMPWP
jgi:hypothetical protein